MLRHKTFVEEEEFVQHTISIRFLVSEEDNKLVPSNLDMMLLMTHALPAGVTFEEFSIEYDRN